METSFSAENPLSRVYVHRPRISGEPGPPGGPGGSGGSGSNCQNSPENLSDTDPNPHPKIVVCYRCKKRGGVDPVLVCFCTDGTQYIHSKCQSPIRTKCSKCDIDYEVVSAYTNLYKCRLAFFFTFVFMVLFFWGVGYIIDEWITFGSRRVYVIAVGFSAYAICCYAYLILLEIWKFFTFLRKMKTMGFKMARIIHYPSTIYMGYGISYTLTIVCAIAIDFVFYPIMWQYFSIKSVFTTPSRFAGIKLE